MSADTPEPACEYAHPKASYRFWDRDNRLIAQFPLCDCCFPDGEVPPGVDRLVRARSRCGAGQPHLHIDGRDTPDGHVIAPPPKATGPYGTQLAAKLDKADPDDLATDGGHETVGCRECGTEIGAGYLCDDCDRLTVHEDGDET